MEQNKIMIWGTGMFGRIAYHYYSDKCSIAGYIDSDEKRWGNQLNGIEIYAPSILQSQKIRVVIAMKKGIDDVYKRLKEYNVEAYTIFKIEEQNYSAGASNEQIIENNSIICCLSSGLGNQMFQYALLKSYELLGKSVYGDISAYLQAGQREFNLLKTFPNVQLRLCTQEQKEEYVKRYIINNVVGGRFVSYVEPSINETKQLKWDKSILDINCGVIKGYHQYYQIPMQVRDVLLKEFEFPKDKELKLRKVAEYILKNDYVSIHVRRGDYLSKDNEVIYGNICTDSYYENAIKRIKEKHPNIKFCFFSNDIEWVKRKYSSQEALYIEASIFDNYQDWYDMYLMSLCKHNIIANSTFSWWGAWLNQNEDKIVVAPRVWLNRCEYKDICPPEWIRV